MPCFFVACPRRAVRLLAVGVVAALGGPLTFAADTAVAIRAVRDPTSGQINVVEGGRPVLRYNYQTVQPPAGFLDRVEPGSRKYAQPRSDYIHPLFGLDGETLTADWSKDHPHHRGVYWAWPEVDYLGHRGDLHALQTVFARPTGRFDLRTAADYAEIEAENVWKWEDRISIMRETVVIRAWRRAAEGRFLDLSLRFEATDADVAIARRDRAHYGGLNIRLAPMANPRISLHTDPAAASPRRAWGEAAGVWRGGGPAALAVFQLAHNPEYPAEWVEYPGLPWFQPTFPTAMTRFVLKKGQPLELRYRLWIRRGDKLSDKAYGRQWQAYQQANGALPRVLQPLFHHPATEGEIHV